ncbi:hypothetical protein ACX3VG_30825 [Escherichia coli]
MIRDCCRPAHHPPHFQPEDGIRDDVESRGLGDVYKRQIVGTCDEYIHDELLTSLLTGVGRRCFVLPKVCESGRNLPGLRSDLIGHEP